MTEVKCIGVVTSVDGLEFPLKEFIIPEAPSLILLFVSAISCMLQAVTRAGIIKMAVRLLTIRILQTYLIKKRSMKSTLDLFTM